MNEALNIKFNMGHPGGEKPPLEDPDPEPGQGDLRQENFN